MPKNINYNPWGDNQFDTPSNPRGDDLPDDSFGDEEEPAFTGFAWNFDDEEEAAPTTHTEPDPAKPETPVKTDSAPVLVNRKKSNVIVRNIILVVCAFLMVFGVYRIVVPEKTLTNEEITAIAAQGMGVSSFPATKATTFVVNFANVFLSSSDDRQTQLAKFGLQTTSFNPAEKVEIASGPFIGDIKYQSPTTASFTISANLTRMGWVYFSVPVYYDADSDTFLIISDPTAVPAPAALNGSPKIDEDALGKDMGAEKAKAMQPTIETFFKAYGASDQSALETVTLQGETEPSVFVGFANKYTFNQISNIKVRQKDTMPESNYWVTADVSWSYKLAALEDDESGMPNTPSTMVSSYQMKVKESSGKFYVIDITPMEYSVTGSSESASAGDVVGTDTDGNVSESGQ